MNDSHRKRRFTSAFSLSARPSDRKVVLALSICGKVLSAGFPFFLYLSLYGLEKNFADNIPPAKYSRDRKEITGVCLPSEGGRILCYKDSKVGFE